MHEYQYHDAVYSGLGSGRISYYNKVQRKNRRSLWVSRMVRMWEQCAWSRWERAVVRKVSGAARATSSGLLETAQARELKFDLGEQLKFPETAAKSRCML